MAFTLVLLSTLSPEQVARAINAAPTTWQLSRLPGSLHGEGIYALSARATPTRFALRLRSQKYPAPLLAEVRGRIGVVPAGRTFLQGTAALPRHRVWLRLALAGVAFWAGHISLLGYVICVVSLLRVGQYLMWNARLTLESPSAGYLFEELRGLLGDAPPGG